MQKKLKLYQSTINSKELYNLDERVLSILGNKSPIEPFIKDAAQILIKDSHQFMEIKFGYNVIDSSGILVNSNNVYVSDEITFECSKIISSQLKNIEGLIIFVATLGSKFDSWFKELFNSDGAFEGYIADLIGSVAVECAADILEQRVNDEYSSKNIGCSNRYSPGYCEWDVSEQKKLFYFLPKNFCGIKLTESSLMLPIKSVSGIIGLGKNVEKKEYACKICTQENCYMNKLKAV